MDKKILNGPNLGYDRCPNLSFFVTKVLKGKNFKPKGRRDLNIKKTPILDRLKCQRCDADECDDMTEHDASMNVNMMQKRLTGGQLDRYHWGKK
ncbi:hypothetical protein MTR_5g052210 [Medicago truncatula]|uniref:Uncharacterized protein n=1 Tax=Medicago truncatula TaxID=3880 RepID=A0A072UFR2_MEDTR|nr:hypothetical protein MTR_5g052210 [Medicago truncatula]